MEGFRKHTCQRVDKYKNYRKYYAYNDKNIVVMIRETNDHEKAVCIIVNLGDKAETLSRPIVLPGHYQNADVWYQTDFCQPKGVCTDVEIIHHNNVYEFFDIAENGDKHSLVGSVIPPGFSCLIECTKSKHAIQAIRSAEEILKNPIKLPPMGALDYNLLLFGISREEETRFGESNYVLPHNYQLIYAGFGGIYKMLKDAKRYNNLSTSLFDNLREGRWLLHYYVRRVKRFSNLSEVADVMERYFAVLE